MAGTQGMGRRYDAARCPDPTHRGSHVVVHSIRTSKAGVRRAYRCTPLVGDAHHFTVVISQDAPPTPSGVYETPPPCPQHAHSRVVRDGIYGKRSPLPRQRYRCYPNPDGTSEFHSFTPPLPRQHIHAAGETCAVCDEQRGVHRGDPAVARQHSWPAATVARGLERLAAGGSYADVSRWALRMEAAEVERAERAAAAAVEPAKPKAKRATKKPVKTAPATSVDKVDPSAPVKRRPRRTSVEEPRVITLTNGKQRRRSRASVEAKNVWHIAADWCEVFGPVIWQPLSDRLHDRALAERARLDALKAAGQPLVRPQVLLIDDMPVYGRDAGAVSRSRRGSGFFLLVAAEVEWHAPDPFDAQQLPVPTTSLRLVRAFARSNAPAWRLLFDELGYTPDFVVADAGTGQYSAVRQHYPTSAFIPSVWHVQNAIRTVLRDVPAARLDAITGRTYVPALVEHLRLLHRGSPALTDKAGLTDWWDRLLTWAQTNHVPTEGLRNRRKMYEQRMADALPMMAAHPEVPISTGGLETVQRRVLEPVLAGRRWVFGNVERTNTLLDLAVARELGAFDDLTHVAGQLRIDATGANGWAPPLRAVADPGGTKLRYSSLRDTALLRDLVAARGLT